MLTRLNMCRRCRSLFLAVIAKFTCGNQACWWHGGPSLCGDMPTRLHMLLHDCLPSRAAYYVTGTSCIFLTRSLSCQEKHIHLLFFLRSPGHAHEASTSSLVVFLLPCLSFIASLFLFFVLIKIKSTPSMSFWLIGTQLQPFPADDWNTAFCEPELNTSMW